MPLNCLAKRLKELEKEDNRLFRLLANLNSDNTIFKKKPKRTSESCEKKSGRWPGLSVLLKLDGVSEFFCDSSDPQ
jgi:hypothetical protein